MEVPEAVVPLSVEAGPDPLPTDAVRAVDWIGGEQVLCSWRTPHGYLVLTNLRCISVWKHLELFAPSEWRTGPNFFFFAMAPPGIVGGRFVELREAGPDGGASSRFLVRDPEMVRGAIAGTLPAGRREWEERRRVAAAENARLRHPPAPPVIVREIVREIVRVPCQFCGRLMDDTALRCPFCGGPHRA
jgi:hypothetical protein